MPSKTQPIESASPPQNYRRHIIQQNDHFEIVQIQWDPTSVSVMHNHGWSHCLVLIEEGKFENTVDLGMKTEVQLLEKGQVLSTPVTAQHKMKCLSATGRTLHVYTPRIREHRAEENRFQTDTDDFLKSELRLSGATSIDQLREVLKLIESNSVSTNSPFFMNQLFSGVTPQLLMAEDVIARTKTTMATHEASPALANVESEVVEKLCAQIGWNDGARDGICVPGGSAANFMAIHCARQRAFPDLKAKGMASVPHALQIFVSSEAHYSFQKAAAAMGLGTDNVISVPSKSDGRMDVSALEKMLAERTGSSAQGNAVPLMVSATAGTTVMGAFDPIEAIADVCQKFGVWLHVDAAWGGPALFTEKLRSSVAGIERADSVTFDAHKLFGASLTCSYLLTRHTGLLLAANDVSGADYLFHEGDVAETRNLDRGKMSWQCGRRADSLSFWAIWKSLGNDGLGLFVERLLDVRDETMSWIKTQGRLQLVADPEFLNVCVRIKPPFENQTIDAADWSGLVRERLKEQNLAFVNYSSNGDGQFLRLILANPRMTFDHVQQILQMAMDVKR